MNVSVIIPTYNGAHKLPGIIHALTKQTFKDLRIIVVVDGSTDETLTVLKPYSKQFKQFKIICQPNRGRSAVRNKGFENTSDDIIIFYDDDVIPSVDSVERHVRFHRSHLGLCTGSVFEKFDSKKPDIFNYKAYLTKKWLAPYPDGVSRLSLENLFFTAANCSIKQKFFFDLNGFNEELTDGEDYDLAMRALMKGIPIFFDRGNEAIHEEKITLVSMIKRQRQYWMARDSRLPQNRPTFKHFFIYWFFSLKIWMFAINNDALKVLPRKARYWFYDKVVFAWARVFPNKNL